MDQPAIGIDQESDLREGEERDSQRQHDCCDRILGSKQIVCSVNKKARILEIAK